MDNSAFGGQCVCFAACAHDVSHAALHVQLHAQRVACSVVCSVLTMIVYCYRSADMPVDDGVCYCASQVSPQGALTVFQQVKQYNYGISLAVSNFVITHTIWHVYKDLQRDATCHL
jgi:hypothetical protein